MKRVLLILIAIHFCFVDTFSETYKLTYTVTKEILPGKPSIAKEVEKTERLISNNLKAGYELSPEVYAIRDNMQFIFENGFKVKYPLNAYVDVDGKELKDFWIENFKAPVINADITQGNLFSAELSALRINNSLSKRVVHKLKDGKHVDAEPVNSTMKAIENPKDLADFPTIYQLLLAYKNILMKEKGIEDDSSKMHPKVKCETNSSVLNNKENYFKRYWFIDDERYSKTYNYSFDFSYENNYIAESLQIILLHEKYSYELVNVERMKSSILHIKNNN